MKKFCANLKEHTTEMLNCEKRKWCLQQKLCHIYKKEFDEEFNEDQNYCKVWDYCYYTGKFILLGGGGGGGWVWGAVHNICNLRYRTPKEILVVFHNVFNYDCNFTTSRRIWRSALVSKRKQNYITLSAQIIIIIKKYRKTIT